jgi:serine acetyltransferase
MVKCRMSADRTAPLKRRLSRLWIISPERLWLLSIALHERGRWQLAFLIKQLNTILYHNSLAPGARVSPDIALGHFSHGIVIANNVEIGRCVKVWHNVTLTAGRPSRNGVRSRIIVDDYAKIGTNAVIIAPRGSELRIGRGARVGAGAIVTQDVPDGATAVSPPARVLLEDADDVDAESLVVGLEGLDDSSDPTVDSPARP